MALNLVRAGTPVVAWNRTPGKAPTFESEGGRVVDSVEEVFERADKVLLMLVDSEAVDAVLGRGSPAFAKLVAGHTIINMGTMAPGYSRGLEADLVAAGGHYVEAPVSGSRKPAEAGQLVAMLAGHPDSVAAVRPLLSPMCRESVVCGPVPNALSMKLASNLFLTIMLAGLAEAVNYARRQGVDLDQFVTLLGASPLSSDVLKMKAPKFVARDFTVQASMANVLESLRLITEAAGETETALPVLDTCHALYREASDLGLRDADVSAVLSAIEERSGRSKP